MMVSTSGFGYFCAARSTSSLVTLAVDSSPYEENNPEDKEHQQGRGNPHLEAEPCDAYGRQEGESHCSAQGTYERAIASAIGGDTR